MTKDNVPIEEIEPGSLIETGLGTLLVQEMASLPSSSAVRIRRAVDISGWMPENLAAVYHASHCKVVDNGILLEEIKTNLLNKGFSKPNLTTGCDPEIFVLGKNNKVLPAWEFLQEETFAKRNSGNIPCYWDGAQAEMSPLAGSCLEQLVDRIHLGLKHVLTSARLVDPEAKFATKNVVELPRFVREHSDLKYIQFRCSASNNVYDDPGYGVPDPIEYPWRCAGGHIHLGSLNKWSAPCIKQGMEALDGILGVLGVSLAANLDDPERRKTYGRAGEFRLPKHGIEYRVLSNFWLVHPAISHLTLEVARAAFFFGVNGLYRLCWKADQETVREVINNCDVTEARKMLEANKHILLKLLGDGMSSHNDFGGKLRITNMKYTEAALTKPVQSLVNMDIEDNWHLIDGGWKQLCGAEGTTWASLSNL